MKLIACVIFLLMFFCQTGLNAQGSKFDSVVVTGIEQIYSIEFEKAEKTFRVLISDYPKHPAWLLPQLSEGLLFRHRQL